MAKSRVLVIGGGGIGTIVALNLSSGNMAEVTMVLRSNFEAVQKKGFNIKSVDHGEIEAWKPDAILNKVPHVEEQNMAPFDYVVCCTKNIPDLKPTVADILAPAITPNHTSIVLIQNGLNIEKPILAAFPTTPILSGVTFMGSHEPSPGTIEHTFADKILIGAFDNPNINPSTSTAAAQDFATIYSAGGKTDCQYTPDANFSRWEKLVYNATMNPLCALLRTDTSRLRLSHSIDSLVRPAMQEVRAAALAKGHALPETVVQKMIDMDPLDLFFQPSMCVDALKGNPTEYEVLVGEPLREGLACGVPMPTLNVIYNMCKTLQWQLKEQRQHLP